MQVFKDRKVKLPLQLGDAFDDYLERYDLTGQPFPCSPQFVSRLIAEVAEAAGIRKQVMVRRLRDAFVVRSVRRAMKLEEVFEKIGLVKTSYGDGLKKYGLLTKEAL